MLRVRLWIGFLFLASATGLYGQFTRTSVPLGQALDKALEKSSLTNEGARPFHIRVVVSEPANPQSPYQGTIEEWWVSANRWRREVTSKEGMHQTIVVTDGQTTERDDGDYYPLWLREFEMAIVDPIPDAAMWGAKGIMIDQITLPNGQKSDACARLQGKIGTGNGATDAFWNVCFDGEGRLKFVGSPRYGMEFHDYRTFGKKQIAGRLVNDPEPGTELVGVVTVLEREPKVANTGDLFAPLPSHDDRFRSIALDSTQMERLTAGNLPISWPTVRSGKVQGHLALYVSADAEGNVREVWPLNSDNADLSDAARDQLRKWKLRPAVDDAGHPVQVDGGVGFAFSTRIDNPLPVITGADIEKVVSGCAYRPTLPAGLLPGGKSFAIRASVNEEGKLQGESFPGGVAWDVIQNTGLDLNDCRFKPWIVNGQPTYYFIDFVFTAP